MTTQTHTPPPPTHEQLLAQLDGLIQQATALRTSHTALVEALELALKDLLAWKSGYVIAAGWSERGTTSTVDVIAKVEAALALARKE